MKKNFFKKLSFVLALAMIIATIAPAAGAFAATALHLNSTTRYLYLGGVNEFDFNISHAARGSKAAWLSSDEDVAEVDETTGYVTAVGIGTATISVDVTAPDGTVTPLEATVIVRDNVATINSIYCQTDAKQDLTKLAVGKDYDFGRTFTTKGGSTTATSSKTVWTVNSTKATISTLGVFKATEAGDYTITVLAFQSTAKANEWKAAVATDATSKLNVLDSKTLAVKVVVGLTKVELVTPTQLKLTFDSSVKDVVKTAADVKVNQVVTAAISAMIPVKSLDSVSADGKTVTFSVYDKLANNVTYTVAAAGLTKDFVAQIGAPVSISMKSQTVPAGTATALAFTMLDQYGVDVSSLFVASVSKSSTVGFTNASAGSLLLSNNQVAFVKYTYNIINSDGTVTTISTDTVTVTGVTSSITGTLTTNLYSSMANSDSAFATAKTSIALGTTAYLNARAQKSDGSYNYAGYTFESLNPTNLIIDRVSGLVTPIAVGTAVVKVFDSNSVVVGYASINVTASSATASIEASATVVRLSNNIAGALAPQESATVTIKNVDQYSVKTDAVVAARTTADTTGSYVASADRLTDIATISTSGATITFTAVAGKTGSFTYVVRTSENKLLTISVVVGAPGVLNNYTINSTATTADANVANTDTTSSIDFSIYGMDAAGLKQSFVTAAAFVVTGPTGFTQQTLTPVNGVATFTVDDTTATAYPVGTYTLTATVGGISYVQQFTVTNSRALASLSVAAYSVTATTGSSVLTSIENALELTLNGGHAAITSATYVSSNSTIVASAPSVFDSVATFGTTGTLTVYVKQVKYNAGGVVVTLDVNKSITVTVQ
jgi:hypothetical protein